jgi:hypothetical protein
MLVTRLTNMLGRKEGRKTGRKEEGIKKERK